MIRPVLVAAQSIHNYILEVNHLNMWIIPAELVLIPRWIDNQSEHPHLT